MVGVGHLGSTWSGGSAISLLPFEIRPETVAGTFLDDIYLHSTHDGCDLLVCIFALMFSM